MLFRILMYTEMMDASEYLDRKLESVFKNLEDEISLQYR